MEIIAKELSQRGMALLNIEDDSDVINEISERINLKTLRAKVFQDSDQLKEKDTIIVSSKQLDDVMEALPKGVKLVPVSFGKKNASL